MTTEASFFAQSSSRRNFITGMGLAVFGAALTACGGSNHSSAPVNTAETFPATAPGTEAAPVTTGAAATTTTAVPAPAATEAARTTQADITEPPTDASTTTAAPSRPDPLDISKLPDGPISDTDSIWSYDTDPLTPTWNQEAQVYTKEHAVMRDGRLTIDAVKTPNGYASSRIHTLGKFAFTYGTITASVKLPEGVGTWPALWLLPDESDTPAILAKYGLPDDPNDKLYYVNGGEIDWVETVGAEPPGNQPAVHTYATRKIGFTGLDPVTIPIADATSAFHEYGLRKTPGLLEFTLDGKVVHRVAKNPGDGLKEWPFDDYRYYLVANLAMGGSWGGEGKDKFPPLGIDDSKAPWKFEIASLHFQEAA